MGQEEGSTHPAARAGAVLLPMALTVPGAGWEGRVWGQEQGEGASPPPEPQQLLRCLLQEAGRDSAAAARLSWLLSELPLALHPSPALFPTPFSSFSPLVFLFWRGADFLQGDPSCLASPSEVQVAAAGIRAGRDEAGTAQETPKWQDQDLPHSPLTLSALDVRQINCVKGN